MGCSSTGSALFLSLLCLPVLPLSSSVTLHPYCAPAPGHAAWLTGALGFTIPPAWLCHAVPPLHKGGFSLPQGIQRTWGNHPAWPVVFTQAKTAPLCKGSCRRTPTEGLPACLADDAHTRRLVSSICLSAINPPGMAAGPSGSNGQQSTVSCKKSRIMLY